VAKDLWQEVQQLFDAALQHSPEKRQEFLEQECGSNQELLREVESLLAAHEEPGSFMAEPAIAGMAEVLQRATTRFQPGDMLGVYKVVELVGSGGMGEVYRARDARLKRDVAIKVLPRAFAADGERLRRFEQEARSAAALNHPNIISVYDMGTADGSPYIVSELLQGQNLREVLRRGAVPARKALDYAIKAAGGLAAAHEVGIVHRDLKPENLFITKDGRLKILDFGLAKLTRSEGAGSNTSTVEAVPGTEAGRVFGTVGYMSPEQVRGQSADHRSDIFSFGAILYELFSGKRAFSGDSAADTMSAILHQDPPELTRATPPVHPAVDHTIRHCLEKNPIERFQSAHDLRFQLQLAADGLFPRAETGPTKTNKLTPWLVALVITLACACFVSTYLAFRPVPLKTFHRLTFRRGLIHVARFTPDGGSVVYSAQWENEPSDVFTARLDAPGSRALGFQHTELRSISSRGELALVQNARFAANPFAETGLLARAPLSGGSPRPTQDKIDFAEWMPDGTELAVIRETDFGTQLEFPDGKVVYKTAGYIGEPRISPDGASIAFIDHPLSIDNAGSIAVINRSGQKRTLTSKYYAAQGLAWAPRGDEVWFSAAKSGARFDVRAVTLRGRERVLLSTPASIVLQDVSKDGRVLVTNTEQRTKLLFHGSGDRGERELSWLDWSLLMSLSPDGKYVAFFESGEGAGAAPLSYLRETNGAPAVLLGNGAAPMLSPDEQSVVVCDPPTITIYPVGAGQAKQVAVPGFTLAVAGLMPDGTHLWFNGNEPSHGSRYYMTDFNAAKPRPLTPEGVRVSLPGLVLNGKYLAGRLRDKLYLYPVDGGAPEIATGIATREAVAGWSQDGGSIFAFNPNEFPFKVYRVDRVKGKRNLLLEITPSDRAGVLAGGLVRVTADGKSYAYSVSQQLSELQVIDGVR
jgi:eukaryotic-like serine/threonine-protein kinase